MTTFIHVVGLSNTGKTTAIRLAAEELLARPKAQLLDERHRQYVEISKVVKILTERNSHLIGLVSAGDNVGQLEKNFTFLRDFERKNGRLDYIVCASHGTGTKSHSYVLKLIGRTDKRIEIQTTWLYAGSAAIRAAQNRLTQSILNHLP